MLERRNFLAALSAAVATSMLPAGTVAAMPGSHGSLRKQFESLVGNKLRLVDESGVEHQARVVTLDDGPCSPELEQFSIVLEGSGLTDGLYDVYHASTGKLRLGLMSSGGPGSPVVRQRAHFSNFV